MPSLTSILSVYPDGIYGSSPVFGGLATIRASVVPWRSTGGRPVHFAYQLLERQRGMNTQSQSPEARRALMDAGKLTADKQAAPLDASRESLAKTKQE
jgi:hypothetical protein